MINPHPKISHRLFPANGAFPNNPRLPLVVYQQALSLPPDGAPDEIDSLVRSNRWGGTWRWGLYTCHHYHSTAHECLCIFRGWVSVQFGGPGGPVVTAKAGDVLIIPAGLTHKNSKASADFLTLGCYPAGQSPDMKYGHANERPRADQEIATVPFPRLDPIYGACPPVFNLWR
jgi:uncharacterized protein YjlB